MSETSPATFDALGLPEPIMQAIKAVGYETPSPIQEASIPPLLAGRDLLGIAQTGTGKTAAFALPLLSRLDTESKQTQMLVLAPTRELAIQVAEACQSYASKMKGFHVLPIYGGQSYENQLRQLRRGAQVIVGTPGRVMDLMRRGALKLDNLKALVLDEADEMLRMGFLDDVEWVLEQTPPTRQIALFSATMPAQVKRVAQTYLKDAEQIQIAKQSTTASTITQKFWRVSGLHKLDALTRILEMQQFDAMLIFVRTKSATEELAEKLSARGYSAEGLNGDMSQQQRERTVQRLKNGKLDILIGTDVVARGLDVERISHVVNYDIPFDTESYVHRIGRTGRAGRSGEAILFVAPREMRMLRSIERATGKQIEQMELPSVNTINEKRIDRFLNRITETLDSDDELDFYTDLMEKYLKDHESDPIRIMAAMAKLVQGDQPLLMKERSMPIREERERRERPERGDRGDRPERRERRQRTFSDQASRLKDFPDVEMTRYVIHVGHDHGVQPKNIVGAIANEADLEARYIGQIEIFDEFTTVDLPAGMPKDAVGQLRKTVVCGQRLQLRPASEGEPKPSGKAPRNNDGRPPRKFGAKKGGGYQGKRKPNSSRPPRQQD